MGAMTLMKGVPLSDLIKFIRESNAIEGIRRRPTPTEIAEAERFMGLSTVTVADLQRFVEVCQPGAVLRDQVGLDVRVGAYYPPLGGPHIVEMLGSILIQANDRVRVHAWQVHLRYETLHPFVDGNGRSGRMLWAWMWRDLRLGFLHQFYYQTLDGCR